MPCIRCAHARRHLPLSFCPADGRTPLRRYPRYTYAALIQRLAFLTDAISGLKIRLCVECFSYAIFSAIELRDDADDIHTLLVHWHA